MQLNRRRFLAVFATTALAGLSRGDSGASGNSSSDDSTEVVSHATVHERFHALGTEAQITLVGERRQAETALVTCRKEVAAIENAFSLYDPNSMLSQLNRNGYVTTDERFSALLQYALAMAEATDGAFDPTIQPLWRAYAHGDDIEQARHNIGWRKLILRKGTVRFTQPNMAASFNGIAQGFAADRVSHILKEHGFHNTLIDLGEFAASGAKSGKPWRLGIRDPITGSIITQITPAASAIATSEPNGTLVAGHPHILDPLERAGERWTSVTVEAHNAWQADALSTAIAASPIQEATCLLETGNATRGWLINNSGILSEWHS